MTQQLPNSNNIQIKDKDLTGSIMDAIATKEPEKIEIVTLRQTLIKFCLGLFLFFSGGLVTLFVLDVLEKLQLLEFVGRNKTEIFHRLSFELIIIALIFFGLSYALYRNTNLPLVKDRLKLLLIIILATLTVAGFGISVIQANLLGVRKPIINSNRRLQENLPFKGQRPRDEVFEGVVVFNNPINILVEGDLGQREFLWNSNFVQVTKGQAVLIKYKPNQNNQLIVDRVKVNN